MLASHIEVMISIGLISLIVGGCYFIFYRIGHRKMKTAHFFRHWVFLTYLLMVGGLTLLPLPGPDDFLSADEEHYIFIPFNFLKRIYIYLQANPPSSFHPPFIGMLFDDLLMQPILNIVLMIPLGFYFNRYLKWSLLRTLMATFLFSFIIELLQLTGLLFIYDQPYRLFEVDDLMTNTFGGFCGFWLSNYLKQHYRSQNLIKSLK